MLNASNTVSDVIHAHFSGLTRAERQLAESLLEKLSRVRARSITTVAENAGVSTPDSRADGSEIGLQGYPEFQAHLHQELDSHDLHPIAKHDAGPPMRQTATSSIASPKRSCRTCGIRSES